jgi:hypothetical protein
VDSTLLAELQLAVVDAELKVVELPLEVLQGHGLESTDAVLEPRGDLDHLLRGVCVEGEVPSYCASKSTG